MSDREAFENWLKNKNIFSGNDDNRDVIWAKSFMFKAWQAQQAKIDELKMSNHHLSVQLIDSNTQYDHVKKERDELQGLADAALKSIMICEEYNHAEKLDEIYNILKAVEK